jgi:hypothetical protein
MNPRAYLWFGCVLSLIVALAFFTAPSAHAQAIVSMPNACPSASPCTVPSGGDVGVSSCPSAGGALFAIRVPVGSMLYRVLVAPAPYSVALTPYTPTATQATNGINVGACVGTDPRFFFVVEVGATQAAHASRIGAAVRAAQTHRGVPTISPLCEVCQICQACGPGPKLINWTQADVDAVRQASEATAASSAATLAAITALQTTATAQASAASAAVATAGDSFNWGVAGSLAAAVVVGFVTAFRVA